MSARLPNTYVIGAPQSGSRELLCFLESHPLVYLSNPVEPYFWCEDYPNLRQRCEMETPEQYCQLFSDVEDHQEIICEGSTNYLASEVAVQNILKYNPYSKFIVMLRNPVDMAYAFHEELLANGMEDEPDFEVAWHMQEARRDEDSLPKFCVAGQFLQYAELAKYAIQLMRLYGFVSPENRKILIYDDFIQNTARCYWEVLEFLDLPLHELGGIEKSDNDDGRNSISKLFNSAETLGPTVKSVRGAAKRFQKGGWADMARQWFSKPSQAPLTPQFRDELGEFFSTDIRATGKLVGRDLSHWIDQNERAELDLQNS